ncbi:MAG: alpha/beta fold hydrolase [Lapillicoccus sp.]
MIQPDRDVTFDSGGVPTHASYRGPVAGTTGTPAAIIIGGTGDIDRNGTAPTNPPLKTETYSWLADLLSAQGIASIRYDKLGTGATGLGPYAADPAAMLPLGYDQLRVQPARDALAFLAAQPGVDRQRLLVIGHSEGGVVSVALLQRPGNAPAATGLALVEPSYTAYFDILSRQVTDQLNAAVAAGVVTAADADTLRAWMKDGFAQIRQGSPPFPAPGPAPLPAATGATAALQAAIQTNTYGSDPTGMVLAHSDRTAYSKDFDAITPAVIAATIRIPTFVSCGTKDFNTPCGDGTRGSGVVALAEAFPPGVAQLVTIPNMVHVLRDVGVATVPEVADQISSPLSTTFADGFTAFLRGWKR